MNQDATVNLLAIIALWILMDFIVLFIFIMGSHNSLWLTFLFAGSIIMLNFGMLFMIINKTRGTL